MFHSTVYVMLIPIYVNDIPMKPLCIAVAHRSTGFISTFLPFRLRWHVQPPGKGPRPCDWGKGMERVEISPGKNWFNREK